MLFLADEENRSAVVQELESLFKETQSLPHIQSLTEDDITAEVAAFREGR